MTFNQDSFSLPVQNDEALTRPISSEKVNARKIVRELGLKVTRQRVFILETLAESTKHFTAQEIYESVRAVDTEIGFATVYRFLRTLTEHGYLTEVRMGGMPARYEWALKTHHDHLTCTRCGRIVEFENSEIEQLQEKVAKQFGFQLKNHLLELFGLCPSCQ